MYAIMFSLDTETLQRIYNYESYSAAHLDVRRVLVDEYGFVWRYGNLYWGGNTVDQVQCVLAIQDITKRFPWFADSVRNLEMLRIDEATDLMPAVNWVTQ